MTARSALSTLVLATFILMGCASTSQPVLRFPDAPPPSSLSAPAPNQPSEANTDFQRVNEGVGASTDQRRDTGQRAAQGGSGRAVPGAPPPSQREGDPAARPANSVAPVTGPVSSVDESSTQLPIIQNLGRMVIYNTDLTVVVESVDSFPNQLGTIALVYGGYVAGVETKEENGVPTSIVKLKVAPERYEAAMAAVRALATEVREEKAATRDVTEEHDDVATQIASLEATHAQLLRLLDRAGSLEEVLKVQQQAAQVKGQIDRLKGRLIAMERLAELATITAKGYLASAIIPRDYTTARAALRRTETTRANLEAQLKRTRTPDEEIAIRDRLGEAALELIRLQGRITDLEAKAASARVALPSADIGISSSLLEDSLPKEYIETRVTLRRARYQHAEATRLLREERTPPDPGQFTDMVLRINQLEAQLRSIQERARLSGVGLPTISDEDEALLAGVPSPSLRRFEVPHMIRGAWEGSLSFLLAVASGLVFFWWVVPVGALAAFLVRRRPAAATETAHVATE